MRHRLLIPLIATLALLAAGLATASAADAKSRYRVGIGEQSFLAFQDKGFNSLKIKRVRLIVPWDWKNRASDTPAIRAYLAAAKADRKDVMVAFSAHRGCYENGHYSRRKICRAPSVKKYSGSVKRFHRTFRQVKTFQPWNELNNKSQPTYRSPVKAAKYYIAMKKACMKCTVVAADILDSSNMIRYVKRVKRAIGGYARKHRKFRPRVWGLHNYSDVNRFRSRQTRQFMRTVPGKVWLTETGGLVKFLPHFKNSPKRAAKATRYMIKLADRYSKKRRGLKSRIDRVYQYSYYGYLVAPGARNVQPRFDSGLVGPVFLNPDYSAGPGSGKGRKAYSVFKRLIRHKSK